MDSSEKPTVTCPPKSLHRVLIPKMVFILKKFLLFHDRLALLNAVESILPFLPAPSKNFHSNALHYLTHLRLTSYSRLKVDSQISKSLVDLLCDLLLFGPDHLLNPTRLGHSLSPDITPDYAFSLFNAVFNRAEALNCANTKNRNSRVYTFKCPPISSSPSDVLKISTDLKAEIDKYLKKPHYVHFDGTFLRISWASSYNQIMGGFGGNITEDFRYIENPSGSENNYARLCVFTAELKGGEYVEIKGGAGSSEEMFYLKSVQNVLKGEGGIEVVKNIVGNNKKVKIDFEGDVEEKAEDNVQTVTAGEHKIVSSLKGRGVIVSEASKKEIALTKSSKAVVLSDIKKQTIKWSGHAFPGNLGKENKDKKVVRKSKKIKFKCTVVMRGENVREGLRKVVELGVGKLKKKIKEQAGERIVIDKLGE
ncbi:hypothetical protein TrVE_jg2712 [Triparma verrucosa]|uniref:Uncharacterized protein n=2 Tax=Triparma TaxID=722752 RepID=A0A9W7BZY3_9STRA|nr:hypothetical protein TrST_g8888 [Triparma strigata]GMI14154.1 hypothetical protein TrVE_jg2712 [Triparma verrucosa]